MNSKSGGQGKDSLGASAPPLVIFPEVQEDITDEEHQEVVRHYKERFIEREDTCRIIGDYFAEVPPSETKGLATRADGE